MELFFLADDFTGGVDVLLQASRAGQSAVMFLTREAWEAADESQMATCTGVATTFRNGHPNDFGPELAAIFGRAASFRPRVLQYKICSTADSSPTKGSIDPAYRWLREADGGPVVLLVAQPSLRRYTAFGHHFAQDRGEIFRLDRQPTMSTHPSTPMQESDLRVHFREQIGEELGLISLEDLRDVSTLSGSLDREARQGRSLVVADATDTEHLRMLGRSLLDDGPGFVIGSGGATQAFGVGLGWRDTLDDDGGGWGPPPPVDGPVLVLSGSRSALTARQIERAASAPGWAAIPLESTDVPASLVQRVGELLQAGSNVVVHAGESEVGDVAPGQIDAALATVGKAHLERISRLIVAGGDTSGEVLTRLGARKLAVLQPLEHTCLCEVTGTWEGSIEVILKGGQIGTEDFFLEHAARTER